MHKDPLSLQPISTTLESQINAMAKVNDNSDCISWELTRIGIKVNIQCLGICQFRLKYWNFVH